MQPSTPVTQQLPQIAAPTQDEKTMGMIAHFGAIVTGFVAPLVIYLMKKDESKYVAFQSLQALYFSLASAAAIFVLSFVLIGLFIWPIAVVFHVIAGIKVSSAQHWEYPVVGKMARQKIYGA